MGWTMSNFNVSLVWFRRDLRLEDHAALHFALNQSDKVYCVFIFDRAILDTLPRIDRRVEFIHSCVKELDAALAQYGSRLIVRHAYAAEAIPRLAEELAADAVFANRDYEPTAAMRDAEVAQSLKQAGRSLLLFKDQVVFEKDEILSQAGKPFSVFTPYKNAWLKRLASDTSESLLAPYPIHELTGRLAMPSLDVQVGVPTLASLRFGTTDLQALQIPVGTTSALALLEDFLPRMPDYHIKRDFPAVRGTSYLSVHLRFGTISIRSLVRHAWNAIRNGEGGEGAPVWLSELVWREFYFMILHHHPHVVHQPFKPAYDAIQWESGPSADVLFDAWCAARTGYPLIDAAMLQLNQTGYMHNRLRMVTASFLVKDLGIDWRRGERYFAEKLNDYDLAANNGGWQWAASSGCDAQPYFRIFNPISQSEKFDGDGTFIRYFLPQLAQLNNRQIHAPWLVAPQVLHQAGVALGGNYPLPIVMHDEARKHTLERYAVVRKVGDDM